MDSAVVTKEVDPRALLSRARNVYSQFGEDGIIDAILSSLPRRDKWCVEFGAWDGKHLSNTRRLIDEEGYRGIMIEGDEGTFAKLKQSFRKDKNVTCIHALVGFAKEDNLDGILERTSCPLDCDLISIDIDGNDFYVWRVMEKYRPKVICIEFNPTIPTSVDFVQPENKRIRWGCSLLALFNLGLAKGYRLVCANEVNAFFVAEELWDGPFAESAADLPVFRKLEMEPVYLFSGYDGTVLLSADSKLGWHNFPVRSGDVQVLPEFLRRYPNDYSWVQRKLFRLFCRFRGRKGVV